MKQEGLKQKIKYLAGDIRCRKNRIAVQKKGQVYIGKGVKMAGGARIRLSPGVSIRPYVQLWCSTGKIEIGTGSEIGERSRISIANALVIGEKVLFSPNVYVTDCDHAYEAVGIPVMEQGIVDKKNCVIVRDHAYIGINAVIVGNVTIGKGSIIGANSVVTKSIPDYCVAAGVPAKVIKRYNAETGRWEKSTNENIDACELESRILR